MRGTSLSGTVIKGDEIPNLIDELPILAVTGALASGETIIRDASELRVKESDRIALMVAHLRSFGVEVEEYEDGMRIQGGATYQRLQSDLVLKAIIVLPCRSPCSVRFLMNP